MMNDEDNLRETFYGLLAYDASDALSKMEENDSQSARRDFVRTAFAAIEGWLWDCRQKVQSTISSVRDLSHVEIAAFAETNYAISDNGKLREQARFVPMVTMFRFITRIAEEEHGQPLVDFDAAGWTSFNQAISIRHRVTHPKKIADLTLSDADVEAVKEGMLWFFEMIVAIQEQLTAIMAEHLQAMREVGDALKAGDPTMLELYRQSLEQQND